MIRASAWTRSFFSEGSPGFMYQSRSNVKRTPSRRYAATPASAKTQLDALFLGSLRPLFGLRSVISNYTPGGPRCLQCSESDESAMNIGRILFTQVRGRGFLRSSQARSSRKQQLCLATLHVGKETFQIQDAGRWGPPHDLRPAFFIVLAASGLF